MRPHPTRLIGEVVSDAEHRDRPRVLNHPRRLRSHALLAVVLCELPSEALNASPLAQDLNSAPRVVGPKRLVVLGEDEVEIGVWVCDDLLQLDGEELAEMIEVQIRVVVTVFRDVSARTTTRGVDDETDPNGCSSCWPTNTTSQNILNQIHVLMGCSPSSMKPKKVVAATAVRRSQ